MSSSLPADRSMPRRHKFGLRSANLVEKAAETDEQVPLKVACMIDGD